MKIVSFLILLTMTKCVLGKVETSTQELFEENDSAMEKYIDLLSSRFVDDIFEKHDKENATSLQNTENPVPRSLNLKQINKPNLKNVKVNQKRMGRPERRLYESLTSSYLIGNSDDTGTANHLSLLMTQQKSMQNMRSISAWLNDMENGLDEMRDAINRRVADLATGLQRRNMLLGHYNNAGMVGQ